MRFDTMAAGGLVRRGAATLLAVSLLATAVAASPPPSDAAAATPPSLRLLAATDHVRVRQSHGGHVPLDLGVYVAAVGGDVELHASKAGYRHRLRVSQVDADSGTVLRSLAPAMATWQGLRRFLKVTFRDRSGRVAARESVRFCPNNYGRQRTDDSGPRTSRYPSSCATGFPFVKGMVWGVDAGWAVPATGEEWDLATIKVDEGRYAVSVRIAPAFADAFQIPRRDAVVQLDVVVRPPRRRHVTHPEAGPRAVPRAPRLRGVPTVDDPDPATLPDLVALPPWSVGLSRRKERDLLHFASTPWNAGPAPLLVEGFRRRGTNAMTAYQYFSDADGAVVGRGDVGRMRFDTRDGHHHWHFLQFAEFNVLDRSRRRIVRSRKQSFCILPTDAVDLTVAGADLAPWEFGGDSGSVCGGARSLWVRQVLQAGWGDTYFQSVAGQSFDVTDLPNGRYYLEVQVDPRDKLHQTNTANDSALRRIRLRGRPGQRRLHVAPWRGINA